MNKTLPPLPELRRQVLETPDGLITFDGFTSDDMQAYARAAVEADRVSRDVPAKPDRDAIAVNLLRHAGLDKHKARECADLVLLTLAASPQPQPVQAQPVAWRDPSNTDPKQSVTFSKEAHWNWPHIYSQPLYTTPPKAVPLTDEQGKSQLLEQVARAICVASGGNPDAPLALGGVRWHSFLEDEATEAVKACERFIGHSLSPSVQQHPLTFPDVNGGFCALQKQMNGPFSYFIAGVQFAEQAHGITLATVEKGASDAN